MTISPTALTLRHLRAEGWPLVEVVEKWNPHAKIRQDLFGVVDVIAVRPGATLAVQTTTAAHVADRIRKVQEHSNLPHMLDAGWDVVCHGWAKRSGRWVLVRDQLIFPMDGVA